MPRPYKPCESYHYGNFDVIASTKKGKIFWCRRCGSLAIGPGKWVLPDTTKDRAPLRSFDEVPIG